MAYPPCYLAIYKRARQTFVNIPLSKFFHNGL